MVLEVDFELEGRAREIELEWTSLELTRDVYTGALGHGPGISGRWWYRFRIETAHAPLYVCCAPGTTGGRGQLCGGDGARFQLSVYDGAFQPDPWYGEGVTYHIFPDRFARSKIPDAKKFPNRVIHQNWEDGPEYRPDAAGEIHNNDFFGGDLAGIQSKLPYLQELGVGTIYLSPIFQSASNHRYDTGDYHRIDPMLGENAEFEALLPRREKAGHAGNARRGIQPHRL